MRFLTSLLFQSSFFFFSSIFFFSSFLRGSSSIFFLGLLVPHVARRLLPSSSSSSAGLLVHIFFLNRRSRRFQLNSPAVCRTTPPSDATGNLLGNSPCAECASEGGVVSRASHGGHFNLNVGRGFLFAGGAASN